MEKKKRDVPRKKGAWDVWVGARTRATSDKEKCMLNGGIMEKNNGNYG